MRAPVTNPSPTSKRLQLAQQFFKEYYASCFWHLRPDLIVTEAMIPIIVKGLRTHGGKKGVQAAALLID
jgi:hypothetical protein